MQIPEDQWAELHDSEEATKIVNLCVRITAVQHAREVEQFGTVIYLSPKSLLEDFLSLSLSADFLYEV